MAKKPSAQPAPASPTGHRLNREKILDDIRTNRSYRGGSGTDRKSLFDVKLPCNIWVLPDIRPRGPEGEPLPYLELATHWINRTNKEGQKFRAGITCWDHACEREPAMYARALQEKRIKDEKCPICELLANFDEKEFPKDRYGNVEIQPQVGFHLQVIKEESQSRGDDHPIKVLSAKQTGIDTFMELVANPKVVGASKFETEGMFTGWSKGDKRWNVIPLTPEKIWLKDWQKKILDLDLITPTFLPREQVIQDLTWNLPQFPVAKFFHLNGAEPEKKEAKKEKSDAKTPTRARARSAAAASK